MALVLVDGVPSHLLQCVEVVIAALHHYSQGIGIVNENTGLSVEKN